MLRKHPESNSAINSNSANNIIFSTEDVNWHLHWCMNVCDWVNERPSQSL